MAAAGADISAVCTRPASRGATCGKEGGRRKQAKQEEDEIGHWGCF